MLKWLETNSGYSVNGLTNDEKYELKRLRKEVMEYRKYQENAKAAIKKDNNDLSDDAHSISNEDDDDIDDSMEEACMKMKNAKNRTSVSAEVYGLFNTKENFEPRVILKNETQMIRIKARISNSFIFNNLEQKDLETVIGAMEEKRFKAGETVIKQGDDGDCLYVIEEGRLNCFKMINGVKHDLKVYEAGESFGELALLYNSPRAASIVAITDVITWVLDRETFNHIVKDAAQKKREKYESFLKQVDILSTVEPYELMQISDALKVAFFRKNDYIIREGETGDLFYILEEGTCDATKTFEPGKPEKVIKNYSRGEYFGERALIKGEPRIANIVATSDLVKVISLDRKAFKRLLGPIESLLKRNMDKYTSLVLNNK